MPKRDSAISTLSWNGLVSLATIYPYCVINTSSVEASRRYLLRFAFNSVVVMDITTPP